MKETTKDWVIRALKTFWQAGLGALMIYVPQILTALQECAGRDVIIALLQTAGIAAISAGLSALYNGLIKPALDSASKQEAEKGDDLR